jgi:hypothetical protein
MLRKSLVALALCAAFVQGSAVAAPTPAPTPTPYDAAPARAKTIDGQVTGVDFKTSVITVSTSSGKYDVIVLPSTNIQSCKPGPVPTNCKPGFYSIADIAKGLNVHVTLSQRGLENRAQVISILK